MNQQRDKHNEIWKKRIALDSERVEFRRKQMEKYDKEYYKKIKSLENECEKIGHIESNSDWTDNGFGTSWKNCHICGARFDIEYHSISI